MKIKTFSQRFRHRHWARVALALALLAGGLLAAPPARAQTPQPFSDFEARLNKTLDDDGLDVEHHAYHFVVLLDTANTSGPQAKGMLDICSGLFNDYFVKRVSGGSCDYVSFIPFQNKVLDEDNMSDRVFWDVPFDAEAAQKLTTNLIQLHADEPGLTGGHDIEHALLHATQNANLKSPNQAIYIVLSDNPNSDPPSNSSPAVINSPNHKYVMGADTTDFKQMVTKYHLDEQGLRDANSVDCTSKTADGKSDKVYYRIYVPEGVTFVASGIVRFPPPTQQPPQYSWEPVLIGVLIALALAVLGYWVWLKRPRNVMVNGGLEHPALGLPLYIVEENRKLRVSPKAVGEKVASLHVNHLGGVVLQGESFYTMRGKQAILNGSIKEYEFVHAEDEDRIHEVLAGLAQ